jgi:alkylation response protein AidB-like acyl-CoA dehydrogenase
MNLSPDETQAEIGSVADSFLTKELPIARLRELAADTAAPAVDDGTWHRIAELGWLGLGVTEEHGGLGLGLPEETMLFIELGRHLAPGPLRSTVLAAWVASRAGQPDLAQRLISGDLRAGFAVGDFAVDARVGDLLLTVGAEGAELQEVTALNPVDSTDPGVRLGTAQNSGVIATLAGPLALQRARVLAAAELLGITEAVRDMSASYAQTRVQFDKPIGTFQAVKHRCADMAVAAYATRAQTMQAALYVENGHPDADFHSAAAYVLAVKGAATSTADNIQNHGGIGFTWEHDCHLFLKRAYLLEQLLGAEPGSRASLLTPARHEFR